MVLVRPFVNDFVELTLTESEQKSLREACEFIGTLGDNLSLPMRTVASARFYLYRYFAVSQASASPLDVALGCLLISAKAEETPVSIKRLLNAAISTQSSSSSATSDNKPTTIDEGGVVISPDLFQTWRTTVCTLESDILESAQYNFCPPDWFDVMLRIGHQVDEHTEVMLLAWHLLDKLTCHPIILAVPSHFLTISCILEARRRTNHPSRKKYEDLFPTVLESESFKKHELKEQLNALVDYHSGHLGLLDVSPQTNNRQFVIGRKYPQALTELLSPLVVEPLHRIVMQEVYLERHLLDQKLVPLLTTMQVPGEDRPQDLEKLLSLISGLLESFNPMNSNITNDIKRVQDLQRMARSAFASRTVMQKILNLFLFCVNNDNLSEKECKLRCFTLLLIILRRLFLIPDNYHVESNLDSGWQCRRGTLWKAMKKSKLIDFLIAALNDDTENPIIQCRLRDIFLIYSSVFAYLPCPAFNGLPSPNDKNNNLSSVDSSKRTTTTSRHSHFRGSMTVQLATGQEMVVTSTAQLFDPLGPVSDQNKKQARTLKEVWEFTPSSYSIANIKGGGNVSQICIIESVYWRNQVIHLANQNVLSLLVKSYISLSDQSKTRQRKGQEDLLHYEAFLMFSFLMATLSYLDHWKFCLVIVQPKLLQLADHWLHHWFMQRRHDSVGLSKTERTTSMCCAMTPLLFTYQILLFLDHFNAMSEEYQTYLQAVKANLFYLYDLLHGPLTFLMMEGAKLGPDTIKWLLRIGLQILQGLKLYANGKLTIYVQKRRLHKRKKGSDLADQLDEADDGSDYEEFDAELGVSNFEEAYYDNPMLIEKLFGLLSRWKHCLVEEDLQSLASYFQSFVNFSSLTPASKRYLLKPFHKIRYLFLLYNALTMYASEWPPALVDALYFILQDVLTSLYGDHAANSILFLFGRSSHDNIDKNIKNPTDGLSIIVKNEEASKEEEKQQQYYSEWTMIELVKELQADEQSAVLIWIRNFLQEVHNYHLQQSSQIPVPPSNHHNDLFNEDVEMNRMEKMEEEEKVLKADTSLRLLQLQDPKVHALLVNHLGFSKAEEVDGQYKLLHMTIGQLESILEDFQYALTEEDHLNGDNSKTMAYDFYAMVPPEPIIKDDDDDDSIMANKSEEMIEQYMEPEEGENKENNYDTTGSKMNSKWGNLKKRMKFLQQQPQQPQESIDDSDLNKSLK